MNAMSTVANFIRKLSVLHAFLSVCYMLMNEKKLTTIYTPDCEYTSRWHLVPHTTVMKVIYLHALNIKTTFTLCFCLGFS